MTYRRPYRVIGLAVMLTALVPLAHASAQAPEYTFCPDPDGMSGSQNVVVGTDGADALRGTAGRDDIFAFGGADFASGLAGSDCMSMGGGNDHGNGGSGDDRMWGDGGNDTLSGRGGDDRLYGGPGRDRLSGGMGKDLLSGGGGDDRISARDRRVDRIRCGSGRDRVRADRFDVVALNCERIDNRR